MRRSCVCVLLTLLSTTSAFAQSQGDWTVGLGLGAVLPKSDNGTLAGGKADVDNNVRPTFTAEYFVMDNIGIELLAAIPFKHDVDISGIGNAGDVKHLPPTLSINYHIPTQSAWQPYVGVGVNYTYFFDESSPLGDLELDDSFGVAAQVGVDYALSNNTAVRANVRWIDIDSDVKLDGNKIGKAEIDPIVVNFAYVWQF